MHRYTIPSSSPDSLKALKHKKGQQAPVASELLPPVYYGPKQWATHFSGVRRVSSGVSGHHHIWGSEYHELFKLTWPN